MGPLVLAIIGQPPKVISHAQPEHVCSLSIQAVQGSTVNTPLPNPDLYIDPTRSLYDKFVAYRQTWDKSECRAKKKWKIRGRREQAKLDGLPFVEDEVSSASSDEPGVAPIWWQESRSHPTGPKVREYWPHLTDKQIDRLEPHIHHKGEFNKMLRLGVLHPFIWQFKQNIARHLIKMYADLVARGEYPEKIDYAVNDRYEYVKDIRSVRGGGGRRSVHDTVGCEEPLKTPRVEKKNGYAMAQSQLRTSHLSHETLRRVLPEVERREPMLAGMVADPKHFHLIDALARAVVKSS